MPGKNKSRPHKLSTAFLIEKKVKNSQIPELPSGKLTITKTLWKGDPSPEQVAKESLSPNNSNLDMHKAGGLAYPFSPQDLFEDRTGMGILDNRLRIHYFTDDQVRFQIGGNALFEVTPAGFGYKKSKTKEWKTLLKILENGGILSSHGTREENDNLRKCMEALCEKIVQFVNGPLRCRIPSDYRLYTYDPSLKAYRFKFLTTYKQKVERASATELQYKNLSIKKIVEKLKYHIREYEVSPNDHNSHYDHISEATSVLHNKGIDQNNSTFKEALEIIKEQLTESRGTSRVRRNDGAE